MKTLVTLLTVLCICAGCKKDSSSTNQSNGSHELKFIVSQLASNTYCTLIVRDANEKILFQPPVSNKDTTYIYGNVPDGQVFKINISFYTAGVGRYRPNFQKVLDRFKVECKFL